MPKLTCERHEGAPVLNIKLLSIHVYEDCIDSIGSETPIMDLGNGLRGSISPATDDSRVKLQWLRDHGMGDLADLLLKMQREGRARL